MASPLRPRRKSPATRRTARAYAEPLEGRALLSAVAFAPPASVVLGLNYGVAVGELNGDGVPDLVLSGSSVPDHMAQTALGTGGGGFATPTPFYLSQTPGNLVLGDFNGDRAQDGVMVTGIYDWATMLPGDGRGGLGAPTNFFVGERAAVPVAADFNKDGKLDLAMTARWHPDGSGGGVRVLLGDGAGHFAAPVHFPGTTDTVGVASGDFNRDGNVDLVAASGERSIVVFLGNGAGGFSSRTIPTNLDAQSVQTADFEGDGNADLLLDGFSVAATLRGNGAGGFGAPVAVATGLSSPAAADFDGDGRADLAGLNADGRSVGVMLARAGGSFADPVPFLTGPGTGVLAADFDGDGRPDVATTAANGNLNLLLNITPAVATRTYQAEQATLSGPVVSRDHPGYTGTGYADYVNATGDAAEFTVQADFAGAYALTFRYANGGATARAMGLSVNGAAQPGGVTFARTGTWHDWSTVTVTVPLAAGANKVRLVATAQNGPNLDSLSVRATEPPPAATYQAESAALSGPLALSNAAGYTGSGFADYQHARGDSVEFTIEVAEGGDYALDFRYANGSASDRPLELRVDGGTVNPGLSFAPTGSWRTWKSSGWVVALPAGRHTVRLTSTGSNGPNLDALTVARREPPPPVTLQAEAAALSGATVGRGNGGFTGAGYADYRNASGDYVEFNYDAPAAGQYRLDFRYANGAASDRPLELKVNGAVAKAALPFAPTGSWSTWSTSSATATLAAGANKIRLTATGRSGPNLDALTVTPSAAQQAVTYLAQARSVSGGLREVFEVFNPDTGEDEEIQEQGGDSRSAPDFSDFDGSFHAEVPAPAGWRSGVVEGSQHSRLTDGGIFISGQLDGHTGTDSGGYDLSTDLDVTFELAQPRNYLMTYSITAETVANPRENMTLTRVGGGAVFDEVPQWVDNTVSGTRAGTLVPGQYRFVFHHSVGGDVGSFGPYSVDLALS